MADTDDITSANGADSMESFTNGKVSVSARNSYVETNPYMADAFERIADGYMMRAYESQIRFARAYGRGVHSAKGKPAHKFDAKPEQV